VKLARVLLLAALLAPSTLVVELPPQILALAAQPGAAFWAVGADGTLAEGLDDGTRVAFSLPEGQDADRVLLIGGASARWARRGENGAWTWDSTGWVVAGRLPEALRGAYVDVLRALDGQVAPPADALFPTFSDVESDVDFVLGVPAPGRYELVFDAERGARRALATCEALPEAGLERDKLPSVGARPADLRLALTPPEPLPARGALPAVLGREQYPRTVLDGPLAAERAGKTLSVRVPARVLAGRLWIWSPGWRVLLVEGADFSEEETTVARKLEAGRKLVVHVRDAAGAPVGIACVELQDADERQIVAAFDPRGDQSAARLDVAGRAGPGGDITVFGLEPSALTVVAGRCAAGQEPGVAEWDGKAEEITVTVE
jgi:hypothetical protein